MSTRRDSSVPAARFSFGNFRGVVDDIQGPPVPLTSLTAAAVVCREEKSLKQPVTCHVAHCEPEWSNQSGSSTLFDGSETKIRFKHTVASDDEYL